ncbi:MAG: hypothetical protein ABL927_14485 [Bdellovibrionales bacterium]
MNSTQSNQTNIEKPLLRCLNNEYDYMGQLDERLDCVQGVIDSILIHGLTNQSAEHLLKMAEFLFLKVYWVKAEIEAQHGVHEMNMDIFDKESLV